MAMVWLIKKLKMGVIIMFLTFPMLGISQISHMHNCIIQYKHISLKKSVKNFILDKQIKLVPLEKKIPSILVDSCVITDEKDISFNLYLEYIPNEIKSDEFVLYILECKSNNKYRILEKIKFYKEKKQLIKLDNYPNKAISVCIDSDYYSFSFK